MADGTDRERITNNVARIVCALILSDRAYVEDYTMDVMVSDAIRIHMEIEEQVTRALGQSPPAPRDGR